MIGPANRVPGTHTPQVEAALALTAPGQAMWVDLSIAYACGDCAHWAALKGGRKNMGGCREYSARMQD